MRGCTVTKSGFITLINHFPNLTSLDLRDLRYSRKYEPTPPLSRHRFKELFVDVWCFDSLIFVDELSELAMHFDEVAIDTGIAFRPEWPEFPIRVVDAFGANIKCLEIDGIRECMCSLSFPRCENPW